MARLLEEVTTSFLSGMQDSAPSTGFKPSEAAQLLNYRVTQNGEAEVRNGSTRTHTTALNSGAPGYGGYVFSTAGGTVQWIVFAGDSAYYSTDQGLSWTLIASGLRADYWDFATMQSGGVNYLYCANGSTTLYRWDGSSWATEAGPTTGCTRVEVHNERLWTTNGKNIYASKVGATSIWSAPDGVVVPFNTHDGDATIIALYSMGPWLLVFKRNSFGYVEGYGNGDVISAAGSKGLSRDVGCIAFRSLIGVGGNGVIFMSQRGFEFYAPGLQPTVVSRSVSSFLETINWSDIEGNPGIPAACFYPRKLTYECAIPGVGAQNDHTFVYRIPVGDRPGAASIFDSASETGDTVSVDGNGYLQIGGGSRVFTQGGFLQIAAADDPGVYVDVTGDYLDLADNDTTSAVLFTAEYGTSGSVPISVGYDGFVRALDTGAKDDLLTDGTGGTAIGDVLKSRPKVFGDPSRKKRGRTIRVLAESDSTVTPTVSLVADGVEGTQHTVSVPASAGEPVSRRVRVSERGRVLHVKVQNAGAGTRISGLVVGAELLAERP